MRAVRHRRASTGIEHPGREHDSRATRLAHGHVLAVPTLAVRDHDRAPELGVPAVADDGSFADMGRMNGDLLTDGVRGQTRVASARGGGLPRAVSRSDPLRSG